MKDRVPGAGIVVAHNLTKSQDIGDTEVKALRGVDLFVHRGKMMAIMGPSGCGKTTLFSCLSGTDDITSGEVWIYGKPISKMSDNEKSDFRAMKCRLRKR